MTETLSSSPQHTHSSPYSIHIPLRRRNNNRGQQGKKRGTPYLCFVVGAAVPVDTSVAVADTALGVGPIDTLVAADSL